MRIVTKYFELRLITRREWTRQKIREQGRLKTSREYMRRYKTNLGDAMAYVRQTAERMNK